ncbi:MAG: DUF1302 family protein, partial [Myxococcota bacterium]
FELGYQGSMLTEDDTITRNRPYAAAKHRSSVYAEDSPTRWAFDAALRAWGELGVGTELGDSDGFDVEGELDLRALSISRADDHTDVQIGFQQIARGETFGFPIADLVNPRDLRDPYFFEMDWIRRATFTANVQVLLDNLRLQAIATPIPRNNELPERGSPFDPFPPVLDPVPLAPQRDFPIDRLGQDGEYGGRASYLFDFGLDVALLYFYHWNRTPVYELALRDGSLALIPVQERIHTAGLTFSQAFDDWVLRGDTVVHFEKPWIAENLGEPDRITHLQTVLGADMTTESDWVLGGQLHYDQRGDESLQWVSVKIQKLLFDGYLEPQVFAFVGVDNTDRWVQPRIDWYVIDPWTVSLRADFVWGSVDGDAGDLGWYDERHRVMLWTSVRL